MECEILFEDDTVIALNKKANVPCQPDQTEDFSMLDWAQKHCGKTLFVVHRLDRPTSGVLIFAKNKTAAAQLSQQFQEHSIQKKYVAITQQIPVEKEGILQHFLKKNSKMNKMFALEKEEKDTQTAILKYKILAESERYFLWEILPQTGRFHQIRSQLAAINCPIKGDTKYGFKRANKDYSIHLHAIELIFRHPFRQENIKITASLPSEDALWQYFSATLGN